MDGMNCLDAFYFDNYQILDDQIDPVSKFNFFSLVYHRQADLTGYIEAALSKFMRKTALIGTFQQAWPQHGVDVHSARDNRARNLVHTRGMRGDSRSSHAPFIAQESRF